MEKMGKNSIFSPFFTTLWWQTTFALMLMPRNGYENWKISFLGKFWGNFCQFWGNFWDFLAGGASILSPILWQTTFAFMLWHRNEYQDWELHFWGDFGEIFANFGEIFEFFFCWGLPYWPPYWDKQILLPWYGPEMAINASSFYLLPSPFWTLYRVRSHPVPPEIEKFRFSPLTYTHTKPKKTWDRLGKHFLNFGA